MPKLFHKGEWYYEISPTALSESEFEDILVQNTDLIRPNSKIIPFKKTVFSKESSARADLVLIANDYRYWSVIEVEMRRHSLTAHVIPQIRTLRDASYGTEHAAYLASRDPDLDQEKVLDMFLGESPDILVLVNKFDPEWKREIERYGSLMMVFEIFRADSNRHIFAIQGETPRMSPDILTELSFGVVARLLVVKRPAALGFRAGERVKIFVDGQATEWIRFDTGDGCYISPVGNMPIRTGRDYVLARSGQGQYVIRPSGRTDEG